MHGVRTGWLALLVVLCGCGSQSTQSPSPSAAPTPLVTNPDPAPDPASVEAPTTTVAAEQPPLAHIALQCELTKSDGACNQAKPKSMSVTVHQVNSCNISSAGQELSLSVDSSNQGDRDNIRVRVPGYPNPSGRYTITSPNLVALSDAGGPTASNGAAPHGLGSECSNDCSVAVQETAGSVRRLALDVSCNELCVPNDCLRCKLNGGPVAFKLAVACP